MGVGDLIGRPNPPGFPHQGRPIQHPAIEEDLQRADPNPVIAHARRPVGLAVCVAIGQPVDGRGDRLPVARGLAEDPRGVDPDGQFPPIAQTSVNRQGRIAGRAVGHAGQPAFVVSLEKTDESSRIGLGVATISVPGKVLEEAIGVAEEPGGFSGGGVSGDLAAWGVGGGLGDPGNLQGPGIGHARRPGLVEDGVIGGDGVEFGEGRQPAFLEAGREGVTDDDPGARRGGLRASGDVSLDRLKRIERGDRVVGLAHGRADGVDVAIVQAGQEGLAPGVEGRGVGPGRGPDGRLGPHGEDAVAPDRHGPGGAEPGIDREDLRADDHEVGAEGRGARQGEDQESHRPEVATSHGFARLVSARARSQTTTASAPGSTWPRARSPR